MNEHEHNYDLVRHYRLELGLAQSMDCWLCWGWNPGGLLTRILVGDIEEAKRVCHPMLLDESLGINGVSHFEWTCRKFDLVLPSSVKGRENFTNFRGGLAANPDLYCEFKLMEFPSFVDTNKTLVSVLDASLVEAKEQRKDRYHG